jgi:conjugative transfer pilus assembly protein TraH
MGIKCSYITAVLLGLIFISSAFADDWVDNWISQSTYSRPNTYNTQRRGYVTGGKLSLRYQQDVEHLVNVTPPSFKKGCGGIDLFGGSMNYLGPDRLVQKFEQIMSGGLATYAYDLALNVLCEPCAKEMKSLEAIVDRINQLQIDDCKATKAVVAYMENGTGVGESERNSEAISDFAISSGFTSAGDYGELTKEANNESINTAMAQNNMTKHDMVRDCPVEMKRIFFSEGTLMENIAGVMGIDAGKVELMRSMVGDVYISGDLEYGAIAPCPQNNPRNIDSIIYGDFYTRRNGACVRDQINIGGFAYPSLYDWARQNILEISQSLATKTAFSDANELFINTIPNPMLVMISTDIIMQGNDFDAAKMADSYAYMASLVFAYSMMRDLYNDLYNMLYTAKLANFNQTGGSIRCSSMLSNKAQLLADKMRENAMLYSEGIAEGYRLAIAEAAQNSKYALTVKEMKAEAERMSIKKVAQP